MKGRAVVAAGNYQKKVVVALKLAEKLNHKRILIWGYGREGKATERFLRSHAPQAQSSVYEGDGTDIDFSAWDMVIKSPGINTPIQNDKITSQTELFLSQFRDQTIGITGTKGKSTTSALLYTVLSSDKKRKVILVGNIGLPCLDHYDEIDADTVIVFELSCHQLNHCKVSPHIAVFLNLFEDHLDYYGTRENYFRAKASIALHQKEGDVLYCGASVPPMPGKAERRPLPESAALTYDIPLPGEHNQFNASVVYTICAENFQMTDEEIRAAFLRFHGLSHRLEHIGRHGGVDYYDDSISTIPEATIQAIQSIANAKTVIIGGMDRNIDYGILEDFIREHRSLNYLFAYETGEKLYQRLKDLSCCFLTKDLAGAVREAKKLTPAGGACILSPAAASYGYFKNFEERGDRFRDYVFEDSALVFTGDIGFDKYMDGRWRDPALLSGELRRFLESAEHVVVNVEGPLMALPAEQETEGAAQLKHCMSNEVAPFLIGLGADIWSICNNHIMDAGAEGLRSTLDIAAAHGAQTLGAGMDLCQARRPVIVRAAGGIGMISVGYQRACRPAGEDRPGCYRWDALEDIAESIQSIKRECRWCVVIAHAGEEFTPLPSPYTRERYLKYLDMGADLVVAHHPHVPMNYETVGDKAIFYSLGNFIFDTDYQRAQHYTDAGILLKIRFTEESYSFEAMGLRIVRGEERIEKAALPAIFEDVQPEEYERLLPLSVKAFLAATKRQLVFLKPEEFSGADEETWKENFMQPMRSGRVPGETLDFHVLCPIAEKAEQGAWKESKHKAIIDYMLRQMQPVTPEGKP